MTDNILWALLAGKKPNVVWTAEGEEEAIGYARGIALGVEEQAARPIKERERVAKRTLRERPNDPDALHELIKAELERSKASWNVFHSEPGSLERIPVSADQRRMRKRKQHELALVTLLALIWEWREGKKPAKTVDPDNGQPVDQFFCWAAGISGESRLWVLKRYTK